MQETGYRRRKHFHPSLAKLVINVLSGLIHLSPWPELYAVGRYYGIAGIELKIYTEA